MGRNKPGKPRKPQRTDPDADKDGGVSVVTDFDMITSSYHCTVHVGNDFAFGIDRDRVIPYASQVLAVTEQADHDTAVMRLLHEKLGMPLEEVATFVSRDLRPDRPPTNHEATWPLELYAGVGMDPRTGKLSGHVVLSKKGEQRELGRFPIPGIRYHALTVLQATYAADMDGALYRQLKGSMELEPNTVRGVIEDLANYREPWW
jgi:hypothetical protein